ncbi:MAG: hypothetical protein AW10_02533 [Candidatus Accumulibacter appositus]|uniref:TIR domain-containing protein n=2 Tax=Candidatus Accumulibacter TaxID=327159 RepID=A0A011PQ43_9PROT|nr:MAG: hypothetical protein AW10_02533 [Candidatus Accumulibacter appositus]
MAKANIKQIAGRRIFVSYCHADYSAACRLNEVLEAMCRRLGDSAVFLDCKGDNRLMAGDEWKAKIMAAVNSANVFVILMSTSFHASPFCRDVELKRMLERRRLEPHVKVIGIALHKVNLKDFSVEVDGQAVALEELQCLPQELTTTAAGQRPGLKPINRWRFASDAWVTVGEQIEETLLADNHPVFSARETMQLIEPALSAPKPIAIQASHLPYLCDRGEQHDALIATLLAWRKTNFVRPLVLVTEGRTDDCLGKWVERMGRQEIVKSLGFEEMGLSFGHFKPFRWPAATAGLSSVEQARQRFVRQLADVLCPHPLASEEEAFEAHLTRAHPTMLWVDCSDTCQAEHAHCSLEGLLAVLSACPSLGQRTMLVVAINLIREAAAPADARARLATEFQSVIDQAVATGGVQAAMLGSLPELVEPDISYWSFHDDVNGKLVDDIEMLTKALPTGRSSWPMRTFAEVARQWFHHH